jgi:hypothetical protein
MALRFNRNDCQEYFLGGKGGRCVGLINFLPYSADYLEIWEHQPPENLRASPGLYMDCFTSTITIIIFFKKYKTLHFAH